MKDMMMLEVELGCVLGLVLCFLWRGSGGV